VKNAPAVTARRATNQIVLAAEHQALAAIVVETLAIVVVVVIVLAEQTVRVVTTPLIDHAVTVRLIDHAVTVRLIDHAVTATGHTRPVPPVTAMRAHAVMEHRLIDLVAMV
jgi:hypothetical protein